MTVRSVLKSKGNVVPAADPTTTVQDIMDQMELDEFFARVVTDNRNLTLGIVSG